MRKTKIVATIGPGSDAEEMIGELIKAGVNVFRFNMKHGEIDWHRDRMQRIERVCGELNRRVAVLIDLQGPEVRIAQLPEGMESIEKGQDVWFVREGSDGIVLDHPDILSTMHEGQVVYASDGFLEFVAVEVQDERVRLEVVQGGPIATRKTVNFPGAELDFPTLMGNDFASLDLVMSEHVDYVALSFVRSARDIQLLRDELKKRDSHCKIVAKIEHPSAVAHFAEILDVSDAVMVARGDLGLEYPLEEVPALQKKIVHKCQQAGKPVIVATQMLESMTEHPRPTRAEVSDVANAVFDGTDAVMLSGETANGKYPLKSVQVMAKVAKEAEATALYHPVEIDWSEGGQTAAVVAAADRLADLTSGGSGRRVETFVVLTETGKTAELLARLRPALPILAVSRSSETLDQLTLSWGVVPVYFEHSDQDQVNVNDVVGHLSGVGLLRHGDKVIVVHGEQWGSSGTTSVVRIQDVV